MKLISLAVCRSGDDLKEKEAVILVADYELYSFSYFYRGTVRELCNFLCRTVVPRTPPGSRQSIEHEGHVAHVYVRPDGLAGVAVVDKEYPDRVAYTLIHKLLSDFPTAHPNWQNVSEDFSCEFRALTTALAQYQDPQEADALMRVQRELDLTKDIMHKNIDSVLQRGERIDALVEKSNDLNAQSKMFYKQAKKMNSCCVLL
eukprot:TRINITY_DN1670_c0_g1_i1.p1 TRINITY_DN1670_c0_g1~~TRINITY_DN1670_c0_g1_i1.p1  ORF type:complete len:237 (-),score=66.43 TRINITY_DN1670_c0_g1_i1:178-783(-)